MKYPEGPGVISNRYQEGDPGAGVDATTLRSVDMNALTYEIINAIEDAGIELDPEDETQLAQAIDAKIAAATGDFVTQTEADAAYQPVGDYVTQSEADAAYAPKAFRGALVYKSADQSGFAGGAIAFSSEDYDTSGIHSTNGSRLTVPAGVSKVRLSAGFSITAGASFTFGSAYVVKNGATSPDFAGVAVVNFNADDKATTSIGRNIHTAVLSVSPGDYFELRMTIAGDTVVLSGGVNGTWFAMEVIE